MSTEERNLTKRERQKQRRSEKLEQQRRDAAKARRNRMIALGLVALVAVGAVGAIIAGRLAQQREREANIAAAEGRLEELGCTPIEEQPDLGGGHLDTAQLVAADPAQLYPDRPATSGQHIGSVAASGVYDKAIDERVLVHNLEHGYVNVFYDPQAPQEQVAELNEWAQGRIDGDFPKMVVAPYWEELPEGVNFATVAWDFRQLCEQFDAGVAQAFLDQHYNGEAAPERFLQPHLANGAQGVLDPNEVEGPLLFPPLADAEGAPAEAEQPEGSAEFPSEPAEGDAEGEPAATEGE